MENTIDKLVDDYFNATWNSSLVFPACALCHKSKSYESYEEFQMDACNIDIFQYTPNSNTVMKNWIIRFDPLEYKIDQKADDKFGTDTDGMKLYHKISKMLHEKGQGSFVSNGQRKQCKVSR
jgi:hypothetical protein